MSGRVPRLSVEDRLDIVERAARFNHAMDELTFGGDEQRNAASKAAVLECFAPEGRLEVTGGVSFVGHAALADLCEHHLTGGDVFLGSPPGEAVGRTVHTSSDHVVDAQGDGATMKSFLVRYFQLSGSRAVPEGLYIVTQRFEDVLQRQAGRWVFRSRTITNLHANANRAAVLAEMPRHFVKDETVEFAG
jgi:hypothetical protein